MNPVRPPGRRSQSPCSLRLPLSPTELPAATPPMWLPAVAVNIFPFMYLGAKHMVTGYDHLLFLAASSSSSTA